MCTPYIQRNRREEKFKILFHSLLSGTVSQKPSTVEQEQTGSAGFMSINVDMVESEGRGKGTGQLVQEFNVPL